MQGKIPTGSAELDAWLGGGYDNDIITTLYGPAGSGKTNLCLMAALAQARKDKKVIFIDTEGGFSTARLVQLADSSEALKNILLLKATNFTEQQETFDKLLKLVKETKELGLIIVDSIVMLYRLELSGANLAKDKEKVQAINRSLVWQLRTLNEIARKKAIPVIITDQVYSKFSHEHEKQEVEMVGGDILKYWSKCIIELKNLTQNKKQAILRKHRSMPVKQFTFFITNKGIVKEKRFKFF